MARAGGMHVAANTLARIVMLVFLGIASAAESSRKTIHFVRHGEATHNPKAEAKRAAGCSFQEFIDQMIEDDEMDAPLTALGVEQATATRSIVLEASIEPELVLVSPHVRAIDTARIIFPQCSGGVCRMTPFVAREELRERSGRMLNVRRRRRSELESVAEYADCSFAALGEEDPLWTAEVESWESTSARGYLALEYIWSRPEREVAVVCHGGVLEAILNCIPDGEYARTDVHSDAALHARFRNAECRSATLERREGDGAFLLTALRLSGGYRGGGGGGGGGSTGLTALSRRAALSAAGGALPLALGVVNDCRRITQAVQQQAAASETGAARPFQRVPKAFGTEFIAALGDPGASSGVGADQWGRWRDDPGPRGVLLRDYEAKVLRNGGVAPAGWQLDENAWWLEEFGRVMPSTGPLPAGRCVASATAPMEPPPVTQTPPLNAHV